VSKADNADPVEVETKLAELRAKGLQPFALSIIDEESIKRVQSILNAIADDKRVS
jgi:ethanolamine utilization protein EutP (predicted NTPase)